MSEVQAEPLRVQVVIGAGTPEAIVLTSDNVVFQAPDAEARARRYVATPALLTAAERLLTECTAADVAGDLSEYISGEALINLRIAIEAAKGAPS